MIRRLLIAFVFTAALVAAIVLIPTSASSKSLAGPVDTEPPNSSPATTSTTSTTTTTVPVPETTTTVPVTTTTVPPAPVVTTPPPAAPEDIRAIFECIIAHESGGDPAAVNPSSGAGGLFQFLPSSWLAYGGGQFAPLPNLATADQQWQIALAAQAQSYWYPWVGTNCTPVG